MEHPRVDRGGEQVVRRRDGVDVPRQVQVERLHRDDLRVPPAGGAALDPEGRALAGLSHRRQHGAPEVRPQRLAEPDGGRRLALAEGRRGHARDDDVLAPLGRHEAVEDGELDLFFGERERVKEEKEGKRRRRRRLMMSEGESVDEETRSSISFAALSSKKNAEFKRHPSPFLTFAMVLP